MTHENPEDCRLARHCDFFLDEEPVDAGTLFVADEGAGYLEVGRRLPSDAYGWHWELEERWPKPRPQLSRREGRVSIRLKEGVSEEVRRLYRARRSGG